MPDGLVREGGAEQFCCHGCEAAYRVIDSCGLREYYRLLERSGGEVGPAKETGRGYSEYDDPTFHALYCRVLAGGLSSTELLLEGVHCAACVWLVEKLPRVVPGVVEARLDLRRAAVTVVFDPSRVALSRVVRTLDTLGYPAHPARGMGGDRAREARRREDRRMLVKTAVAGACAGNIMLLYFALYAGMFEGIEPGIERMFRWAAMGLNAVCLAWPGMVFARSALAAIRTRTVHLDVPIAMGLYLGGAWGTWKTVSGGTGVGDIYFDSISTLVFFLLIGRFVQQRQQRSASDALELLFSLTPAVARRVGEDGAVTEVPTEALSTGEVVEVRAGDSVPVDGVIESGRTSIDASMLTGESRPVRAEMGERVAAGTVNLASTIRVRTEATGEGTRIGRLMRMVEEASRRRAAIVRLADRWGKWLLWVLLALAGVTLGIWWRDGVHVAVDRAVALLIATCPCGLGLATPLAMTVAIGRAARRGILIKGGDAIQTLAGPGAAGTVVLDKTGTLTMGRLSVVWWRGAEWARGLVAAVEAGSSHPAGRAMARDLAGPGMDATVAMEVVQHAGRAGTGIEGVVNGRRVVVGTLALMRSRWVEVGAEMDRGGREALLDALSPVYCAVEGRCVAVAALGDAERPEAAAAIDQIRARGWKVRVLSGDHPDVVSATARRLGLGSEDCFAGVSPEEKLDFVRSLAERERVVMVGDGVNDAAALAAATVGVAVRGGAEASLAAADVSLGREGLGPLVELLEGSRRTMRAIHWTIATSLGYNVVAAALSMAGLISPLWAAIIMPASSFTVVAICLRTGAFRGPVNGGVRP
ncbi:MAG: heavy metal translocating P-type ATPase metal-binding domain-containing protein [Phycisphaerales bacterium]|nr:heavy metal translocating P-type ATPase metal-binding domain-containing protein [Phycisphaerales bacterium]